VECASGDPVPVLQASELFVMPTLEDGQPFAVAEAMACGLPVIVTTSCGAAGWVTPGRTGWLVAPRDIAGLSQVLQQALDCRSALPAMGRIGSLETLQRAGRRGFQTLIDWVDGRSPSL
jgi:glycosyltransferase involved in cell wall biosynthesis